MSADRTPRRGAQPLLLHTLETYAQVIDRLLDAVAPKVIVEVGSEGGGMTRRLREWADVHDATLHCVEPDPAPVVREAAARGELVLHEGFSPEALDDVPSAGFYVIDGDHNYATVAAEMRKLYAKAQELLPVAVLHDVGWPAGRRDAYYAPERMDEGAVHSHTFHGGVRPGIAETGRGGFRGAGEFAWAEREGGPRNGVLTAVEDFLEDRGDLELLRMAPVFGVGVVFPREAACADAIRAVVGPVANLELLELLERNRIELYLEVLDLQDVIERQQARHDAALNALGEQLAREQAAKAELLAERASSTSA
jgi:Methyltransferase domain